MGVVHKLKSEVIDFILELKKSSPAIGCRELARLTSEKFQLNVSKSSINTILKNSNLSSPVGRRIQDQDKKTFSIPVEKKKQLFQDLTKTVPTTSKPEKKTPPIKELIPEKIVPSEIILASEEEASQPHDSLPLIPDPAIYSNDDDNAKLGELEKKVHGFRRIFLKEAVDCFESVGILFFKYAFHDFYKNFDINGLLNKHFHRKIPMEFEELLCIGYLNKVLRRYSSAKTVANIPIIERVLPLAGQFDTSARLDSSMNMSLPEFFGVEYGMQEKQCLQEVKFIKIIFSDNTVLLLDAQLAMFWDDKLKFDRPALLNKTIRAVSRSLVSNIAPLVFNLAQNIYPMPRFLRSFLNVLSGCSTKTMREVRLETKSGSILTSFNIIPNFRRRFLVGLTFHQAQIFIARQTQKWLKKEPYYHIPTDQVFYFTEVRAIFSEEEESQELRTITLYEENTKKEIFCILTNITDREPQKVLDCFLDRWPDIFAASSFMLADRSFLKNEHLDSNENDHEALDNSRLGSILERYFNDVLRYFVEYYLPKTSENSELIIKKLFSLNGYVVDTGSGQILNVMADERYPYWDELNFIAQRINENMHEIEKNKRTFVRLNANFS